MSSTNKTTHVDLSQYVGSDKPTYLGDYNSDMLKIDSAIHNNTEDIGENSTNIGNLDNLETDIKSNLVNAINEVNTNADTNTTNMGSLSSLNTTDKSTVVNAVNEVLSDIEKFNFTRFHTFTSSEYSMVNGDISASTLRIASNSDGSLAKLYGTVRFGTSVDQSSPGKITLTNSGLAPESDFNVFCCGVYFAFEGGNCVATSVISATFKTNGNIEINTQNLRASRTYYIAYLFPTVTFVKSFGD